MSARRASTALQRVTVNLPLVERESVVVDRAFMRLEWQGAVRLAADRAKGTSSAQWQKHVRTGLLERVMALGADHLEGPHRDRSEVGRRLLAHIDALAEAGLSTQELCAFADDAELEHPGTLWALTLLFGCLDMRGAEDAFEAWVLSLDKTLFFTYRGVREIAEALVAQPNPMLRERARSWVSGADEALSAIGLEAMAPEQLSEGSLFRLTHLQNPLVHAALERLLARSAHEPPRALPERPSWIELTIPALSYEVARARVLMRDFEPLVRLRQMHLEALSALGPYALDVLALACDESDSDRVRELARGLPTTRDLLSAMGRVGLPSLFPRLLAELAGDDFEEDAHDALVTALGPRASSPSVTAWEQAIAALPKVSGAARLRAGSPHTLQSVLEEMKRPELSAEDLRVRADEVFVKTGKRIHLDLGAFGVALDGALAELCRLAR